MKISYIIVIFAFMLENIYSANEPFNDRESREEVFTQEKSAFYILSLEGGGVRGAIIAEILKAIEEEQKKPIREIFDLIVGTSTGGLISLGLSLSEGLEDKKYSAAAAVEAYESESKEIFSVKKILPYFLSTKAFKYSIKNLDEVLSKKFCEQTMKDCKTNVAITAVDTANSKLHVFRSWDENAKDIALRDIARATSAAPTFFKPITMRGEDGKEHSYSDGGTAANNPSLIAYNLGMKLNNKEKPVVMVYINTGNPTEEKKESQTIIGQMKMFIGSSMKAQDEQTNEHLKLLSDNFPNFSFFPLCVSIDSGIKAMDKAKNVNKLKEAARTYMMHNKDKLDKLNLALKAAPVTQTTPHRIRHVLMQDHQCHFRDILYALHEKKPGVGLNHDPLLMELKEMDLVDLVCKNEGGGNYVFEITCPPPKERREVSVADFVEKYSEERELFDDEEDINNALCSIYNPGRMVRKYDPKEHIPLLKRGIKDCLFAAVRLKIYCGQSSKFASYKEHPAWPSLCESYNGLIADYNKGIRNWNRSTNHPILIGCKIDEWSCTPFLETIIPLSFQSYITKMYNYLNKLGGRTEKMILHGAGGMGKSTLAAQYVKEARDNNAYDLIVWINAEDEGTLKNGYINAIRQMERHIKNNDQTFIKSSADEKEDIKDLIEHTNGLLTKYRSLESEKKWFNSPLFIFDNAPGYKAVEPIQGQIEKTEKKVVQLPLLKKLTQKVLAIQTTTKLISSRFFSWVFSFDHSKNQEHYTNVAPYLPYVGHVIVTTQMNPGNIPSAVRVDCFSAPEAASYVKKRLKMLNDSKLERVKELVQKLDNHPLALSIACGYITDPKSAMRNPNGMNIDIFLNDFNASLSAIAHYEPPLNISKSLYTTLMMSIKQLDEERGLFFLLCVLNPDSVPIDMIECFKENIASLEEKSLIQVQRDDANKIVSVSMHRLTQEIGTIIRDTIYHDKKLDFFEFFRNFLLVYGTKIREDIKKLSNGDTPDKLQSYQTLFEKALNYRRAKEAFDARERPSEEEMQSVRPISAVGILPDGIIVDIGAKIIELNQANPEEMRNLVLREVKISADLYNEAFDFLQSIFERVEFSVIRDYSFLIKDFPDLTNFLKEHETLIKRIGEEEMKSHFINSWRMQSYLAKQWKKFIDLQREKIPQNQLKRNQFMQRIKEKKRYYEEEIKKLNPVDADDVLSIMFGRLIDKDLKDRESWKNRLTNQKIKDIAEYELSKHDWFTGILYD
ncbi:MAG: hypothetical protein HEEMFOPI_01692 [Holosporales bacterium]